MLPNPKVCIMAYKLTRQIRGDEREGKQHHKAVDLYYVYTRPIFTKIFLKPHNNFVK